MLFLSHVHFFSPSLVVTYRFLFLCRRCTGERDLSRLIGCSSRISMFVARTVNTRCACCTRRIDTRKMSRTGGKVRILSPRAVLEDEQSIRQRIDRILSRRTPLPSGICPRGRQKRLNGCKSRRERTTSYFLIDAPPGGGAWARHGGGGSGEESARQTTRRQDRPQDWLH